MTDQIIRDFQNFTSNPGNSDQDCINMFNNIVDHFINPAFMLDYDKMQIRKAAITCANNRPSIYQTVKRNLEVQNASLFIELKLPNA